MDKNDPSQASLESTEHRLKSAEGAFCPVGGLFGGASTHFSEESRCLLGRRLRSAALVLAGGFAAFLLRDLILGTPVEIGEPPAFWPRVLITSVMVALTILLFLKSCLTVKQLRLCEFLIFGLPAVYFVWMQFFRVCHCSETELAIMAHAYPFTSVLPWMVLIQIYGIFIPNTWQRSASFVGIFAVIPLFGAWAAGVRQEVVAETLIAGGFSTMVLVLGIVSVAAVYGSHRVGSLRRQAFDAKQLGTYTLRQRLGAGGMGEVFLAEHHLLKRPCAIKLIRPEKAEDENAIARFESEVQSSANLTHPNTIEIYDYGHSEDGTFYYAMEFLPGLNLQEIVDRYGPLPPERVVYLLKQVCSALSEAHSAGLVHRDIKPGNIFAAERGGIYDFAKLLDFGLVKSVTTDPESLKLTMDGTVVGSPLYAPPEITVGEGSPDARSDIYSLGATAYFLLTGEPVFKAKNAIKVIFAHANETPRPPSEINAEIPPELELVVLKCLAKNPDERYANAIELADALTLNCCSEKWTQQRAEEWWTETAEVPSSDSPVPSTDELSVTKIANVPI